MLEETYELLDALDRGDLDALREELGDFLFEAVFLARIAEEDGRFSIGDAIDAIADKLIRRHPHVFTADGRPLADARETLSSATVIEKWEDSRRKERQTAGSAREDHPERRPANPAGTAPRLRARRTRRRRRLRLGQERRTCSRRSRKSSPS